MKKLGEKIRALRKQRGLSLRQLACILEIKSHSHLDAIEAGKSMPLVELLVKIADLFEVSTDRLLKDDLELD